MQSLDDIDSWDDLLLFVLILLVALAILRPDRWRDEDEDRRRRRVETLEATRATGIAVVLAWLAASMWRLDRDEVLTGLATVAATVAVGWAAWTWITWRRRLGKRGDAAGR